MISKSTNKYFFKTMYNNLIKVEPPLATTPRMRTSPRSDRQFKTFPVKSPQLETLENDHLL